MIQPAFEILNQRGTPMFFSDVFANRPTAGVVGRIFISTDTYAFYRDTGTGWDLIGGPGTGTITGSGTIGTLPIWNGTQVIGDSSLLEGASKFTTTKDFQADGYYLSGMTAGSGALYWTSDRVTLANYNPTGDVHIEVAGGQAAQVVLGSNLSTTFYGNIIRNGGLSTQFLKADGSLDSSTYITTNIYNGNGTLSGNRVVSLNSNYLSFAGGQIYIGSQTASSGLLTINNASSDAHIQVVGASAPSIRIDNAGTGATQRLVFGLVTATNNFIQGSTAGDICISTASASPLLFGMWQTTNASEVMRISTANNVLIGTTTDAGYKLSVNGSTLLNAAVVINSTLNISDVIGQTIAKTGVSVENKNFVNFRLSGTNAIGDSINLNFLNNSFNTISRISTFFGDDNIAYGTLTFYTRNYYTDTLIEALRIDNKSNLGISFVPSIWSSTLRAIQFSSGSLASNTSNDTILLIQNAFNDGTGWKYVNNGFASRYYQNNSGHYFDIASNGNANNSITFTQAMTLGSTGNLLIGTTTDSGFKFEVNGNSRINGTITTAGITSTGTNTMVSPSSSTAGLVVRGGSTVGSPSSGNGQIFIGITSQYRFSLAYDDNTGYAYIDNLYDSTNSNMYFRVRTNGTPVNALTIFGSGNLSINSTTDSNNKLYLNGSFRIDGQLSATAGGSSGQHLIINCNGTTYKIALLNN